MGRSGAYASMFTTDDVYGGFGTVCSKRRSGLSVCWTSEDLCGRGFNEYLSRWRVSEVTKMWISAVIKFIYCVANVVGHEPTLVRVGF
jgi:hypothetical protein